MKHNGLQHCCRDDDVTHCPSWNAEEVRLCVLGMLGVQGCCVAFISYAQSGVQFTTLSILDLVFLGEACRLYMHVMQFAIMVHFCKLYLWFWVWKASELVDPASFSLLSDVNEGKREPLSMCLLEEAYFLQAGLQCTVPPKCI